MERAIETQRLRLLRIIAGWLVVVGFLSIGPISRGFSVWACGTIGSILSRAEAAAQYLVIAQARLIAARDGSDLDRSRFPMPSAHEFMAGEAEISPSDLRRRLQALQAVLMDIPRHALRLLRRIEKQGRDSGRAAQHIHHPDAILVTLLDWRLAAIRIERPPDKLNHALPRLSPPPGFRAGGEDSWAV